MLMQELDNEYVPRIDNCGLQCLPRY